MHCVHPELMFDGYNDQTFTEYFFFPEAEMAVGVLCEVARLLSSNDHSIATANGGTGLVQWLHSCVSSLSKDAVGHQALIRGTFAGTRTRTSMQKRKLRCVISLDLYSFPHRYCATELGNGHITLVHRARVKWPCIVWGGN